MAYELTIKNTGNFTNPKLNELTNEMSTAIMAVGAMAEKTKILCAKHLATIDAEELAKEDGFENAVEFAMETMSMSKSNAYAYIQVGRAIRLNQVPEVDKDGNAFTFTKLRALCKVKNVEKLTEAVNNGEINAEMSDDEISATADSINPPKKVKTARPEKRYVWDIVGEDSQTADMSKTDLIALMANNGIQYIGEIKNDDDTYLVAINAFGYPMMYHRGDEVKKVVESEK